MKIKFLEKYNVILLLFFISIILILIFNFLSLNIMTSQEDQVRKIYYADNITQTHQEVINLFNSEHKGEIKVIPINLPFTKFTTNERKELLARSLRSNNSRIDVFAIDQIWVSRFSKWAVDLENVFDFPIEKKVIPELLITCFHKDKLKSIPLYVDIGLLYYRKDLIKKIPNYDQNIKRIRSSLTWEEFINICRENFPDQPAYLFQGLGYEGLICNFIEVMESCENANKKIIDMDDFFKEKSIRATSFFHEIVNEYKIAPKIVTEFNEVQSYRYCFQRDIPFFRGWASSIKDSLAFQEYYSEMDKLGFASLPHFQGGNPSSVFGGWNLMISKNSQEKKAAATFLKFILSDRVQKIFYKKSSYLPVIKSLYGPHNIVDDYLYNIMKEQGVHRPKINNYTRYSDILSSYINKAIKGEINPKEAINRAQIEINNYHKEIQ